MSRKIKGLMIHDDHYVILRELGIKIDNVSYKTETADIIATHSGGMHQGITINKVTFEVSGEITEGLDLDKLHEIMLLLRAAKNSQNPAVLDMYEQLRTLLGIIE